MRALTSNTDMIVFGLLIWSVTTSDVSIVPACWLATYCQIKLSSVLRTVKAFDGDQYWWPIGMFRWRKRMRRHVAERTGHRDAERAHEHRVGVYGVVGFGVVLFAVVL